MRIFFAGSIRGGRNLLPVYKQIIQLLKKLGHTIVSEHVASTQLEESEARLTEEEIFRSDISFIDECDCLVAEVTMPSIGVGYEICYAVSKGKRVLCLYKEGTNVSAMVLGNRRVTSIQYVDVKGLGKSLALYFKNQTENSGI
ncbi:MAG: nucleoside 2-deoxyribosyltransferase [Candidatus Methanoperedens sp.]|nr:nucleoside 2-deoxyribosyltransferase [Candidatus Methanoperedens sp.]